MGLKYRVSNFNIVITAVIKISKFKKIVRQLGFFTLQLIYIAVHMSTGIIITYAILTHIKSKYLLIYYH